MSGQNSLDVPTEPMRAQFRFSALSYFSMRQLDSLEEGVALLCDSHGLGVRSLESQFSLSVHREIPSLNFTLELFIA